MNLEKLGQWVGVVANVGVFAGFLVVAYQLHQNTISLQSTSAYTSNQLFASSDMSMMGDTTYAAFAHSLIDPASLSPEELAQMWGYSSVTMFSAAVAFDDYRQGVISEARWLAVREIFVSYINHPIGRIIWAAQAEASEDARNGGFYDSVQERLDEISPNATQHWFRDMLEDVRALPAEHDPSAERTPSTGTPSLSQLGHGHEFDAPHVCAVVAALSRGVMGDGGVDRAQCAAEVEDGSATPTSTRLEIASRAGRRASSS